MVQRMPACRAMPPTAGQRVKGIGHTPTWHSYQGEPRIAGVGQTFGHGSELRQRILHLTRVSSADGSVLLPQGTERGSFKIGTGETIPSYEPVRKVL